MDNNTGNSLFERLNGGLSLWFARLAALILCGIGVMTFCDVVARYFFNRPFTFTVEVTELLMGMVIFLGIGLTTHDSRHITVDVLTMKLPVKIRSVLEIVVTIGSIAIIGLMVWRMWLTAALLRREGEYTQIHQIIIWPYAYVMAIASILFLTGLVLYIVRAYRRLREPPAE